MNSELKNWSDIRVFLAVYEAGSTLAASKRLNMAQPTVARRIDALEHQLGLTLFQRDNRGFTPTQAAKAILTDAKLLEASAHKLAEKTQELKTSRPIRVTALTVNFSEKIMAIFSAFSEKHPLIQFDFIHSAVVLDLCAEEADIAFRLSWQTPEPSLIRRHISTAQFTLYGAPSYKDKYGFPNSPEEMKNHTILSYKRGNQDFKVHNWLSEYCNPDQLTRTFSEVGLMHSAIKSGQGLGVTNLRMIKPDEDAGLVIKCFEPPEELQAEHNILISPQAYQRPEVKIFIKFFAPRYAALFK